MEGGEGGAEERGSVKEAGGQLPPPLSALPALSGAVVANRHVQPQVGKVADTAGAAQRQCAPETLPALTECRASGLCSGAMMPGLESWLSHTVCAIRTGV